MSSDNEESFATPQQRLVSELKELLDQDTNKDIMLKENELQLPLVFKDPIRSIIRGPNQPYQPYRPLNMTETYINDDSIVNINALKTNISKPHEGRIFLCRCLTIPKKFTWTSITTIVDDPNEKCAIRLVLFHYTEATDEKHLKYILPIGTILAIKNPLFTRSMDDGTNVRMTLRCFPGDVHIAPSIFKGKWTSEIRPSIRKRLSITVGIAKSHELEKLIQYGIEFFERKKFFDAIRFYTKAMEISEYSGVTTDLKLQRAQSYFKLNCYKTAKALAEEVLKTDKGNVDAISIIIKCYWGLRDYNQAVAFLETKGKDVPAGVESNVRVMSALLNQANDIRLQSNNHRYDMQRIYRNKEVLHLAEYVGTMIELATDATEDGGRGLRATKQIKPGQLLIVQKAFAFVEFPNAELGIIKTKKILDPSHDELVERIAEKVFFEWESGAEVYSLYAGKDHSGVADKKTVDRQTIDKIVAINKFYCVTPPRVNLTNFKLIQGVGLWTREMACVNHSCVANCTWNVAGDFIFLRAAKSIEKGSAITISYVNPTLDLDKRDRKLQDIHGFICNCSLCTIERKYRALGRNKMVSDIFEGLREKINAMDSLKRADEELLVDIGSLVNELELLRTEKIYEGMWNYHIAAENYSRIDSVLSKYVDIRNDVYRELLFMAYHAMKEISFKASEAASWSIKILECYLNLKNDIEVLKWVEIVKKDIEIAYGKPDVIHLSHPEMGQRILLFL